TRWAYNDLYRWIEEHEAQDIDVFFRACFDEQGDSIWPERFPGNELDRIRRKIGSFKFSCQYLNAPHDPESSSFKESWLRWYVFSAGQILPESGSAIEVNSLRRFMRVDPAISERPGAARSAIIVDGVHQDGRKFLLETWAKRCQPFEMIEQIFQFQERYDC